MTLFAGYIEVGLNVSVIITKIETFYKSFGSEMGDRGVELIRLFKIKKMISKHVGGGRGF